ncbi:hypothetical protein ACRRTK_013073 [Alexandromys fortis]
MSSSWHSLNPWCFQSVDTQKGCKKVLDKGIPAKPAVSSLPSPHSGFLCSLLRSGMRSPISLKSYCGFDGISGVRVPKCISAF